MAGLGPVNHDVASILSLAKSHATTPANASELEIFYRLAIGRVLFRPDNGLLYFVDSAALSICDLLESAFKGLERRCLIEQLFMDQNKILRAAYRIQLKADERQAILTALRLRGLKVDQIEAFD